LFLPVGALNRFRRHFFSEAEQALLKTYLPDDRKIGEARSRLTMRLPRLDGPLKRGSRNPDLAIICNDIDSVKAACQAGCGRVYFEPDPGDIGRVFREAIATCRESDVRIAWKWPRIPTPEFTTAALPLLPGLADSGLEEVMTEGAMYADSIRDSAPGIRVTGGPDLNVFNACAVRALSHDCPDVTLSPELSGEDIALLCSRLGDSGQVSVFVQGNIPAMITADTLLDLVRKRGDHRKRTSEAPVIIYGLMDTTDRVFPVHPDPWGRTNILNAAELCLIDYLPDLARAGVDGCIIDARWRGPSYAAGMVSVYRDALDDSQWMAGNLTSAEHIQALKTRIRAMAQGGITTGHYLRGLSSE
jgi:putative protease